MPNSLKCRLKYFVRKGYLSEKDLLRIYTDNDVVEELEKIKAEIDEQKQDHCFDEDDMFVYITGLNNAIDIVDKYKNELKGEEKKGKWVWDWSISCECPKYVCSVCGEAVWLKTDRCPKCKAIMKGDNK